MRSHIISSILFPLYTAIDQQHDIACANVQKIAILQKSP